MTRINTNVSSLNAQKTLSRSNVALQESLTRLSTGLRINKGKDDPAGLIASEVLRADIVSVERAITNSNRANQMIATADSALGQVSSLLNDIRGLISEGANTGAMSDEQIAANQLQIDSSLEAIDRISQVTQFQGRRLLDGSLDFITENVSTSQITDLTVEQANFGALSQIDVSVDVTAQATQASLNYGFGAVADDVVLEIGGKNGFEAFSFESGATIEDMAAAINLVSDALGVTAEVETAATKGSITASSYGTDNDITITADTAGADEGNIRVKYTADNSAAGTTTTTATYTQASGSDPGTLNVQLETEAWTKTQWSVNGDNDQTAENSFTITSNIYGEDHNFDLVINSGADDAVVYDHAGKTLTITVDNDNATIVTDIKTLITGDARLNSLFTLDETYLDADGTGVVVGGDNANTENLTAGVTGGTIVSLANDVITAINNTATLQDDVTAALATGNDGHELVTAFQESTFYGSASANNWLQFFAPEDGKNIRFASSPGQALGVDLSTDPEVLGFSSAIVQGLDDETSFKITAKQKGTAFDDVEIIVTDTVADGDQVAVWDPEAKTLTLNLDNATDTMAEVIGYINNNDAVSKYFKADLWGSADGTVAVVDTNFTGTVATTSGGVVSEGTVIINLETDADGVIQTSAAELITFFDDTANHSAAFKALGLSVSNADESDGSGMLGATTSDLTFTTSGTDMQDAKASATVKAVEGQDAMFDITAKVAGAAYDGVVVEFEDTAATGSETIVYDAMAKKLTFSIDEGTTTVNDIISMFAGTKAGASAEVLELFSAALTTDIYAASNDSDGTDMPTTSDTATLSGGTVDAGTEDGASLLGNSDLADTGLTFKAVEYGSDAFISVKALNGTTFDVADNNGTTTERIAGTDISARINGVKAIGDGLTASLNTSALDLAFSVSTTVTSNTTMSFSITGGGAQFQLGPDVVSNQQARMGISSVNTAKLGGSTGRLFELRSGKGKSLASDVSGAATVVEEVITQIVNLRGRLGAFQRTTLDTNIATLGDTLEALTAAESDIRDADFAAESANLTRAQVLVQSGLSVLSIANSNPQSVLSLLR